MVFTLYYSLCNACENQFTPIVISLPAFYFQIVDFRDQAGHGNLWSLINKRFVQEEEAHFLLEYFLSELAFTITKMDDQPDAKTGLLQIVFRSDSHRKHKLFWDGGYIEMKVCI